MEERDHREDDVGNESVHEELLSVPFFKLISINFEDNFYKRVEM